MLRGSARLRPIRGPAGHAGSVHHRSETRQAPLGRQSLAVASVEAKAKQTACRAKYAYRRGQLDHALDVVETVADELADRIAAGGTTEDEVLRRRALEADQNLRWQLARFSRDRVHRRRPRPGPTEPPPSLTRIIHTLHGTMPTEEERREIEANDAERRRYELFWRRRPFPAGGRIPGRALGQL